MGEGTRVVDYGKDIADLAQIVSALQQQVETLKADVASLRRALEAQGTLYGGSIAYSTTYVNGPTPDFTGFRSQFKLGENIE